MKMLATVPELNQHFMDLWRESDTDLPELGRLYSADEKDRNEKQLLQLLDQLEQVPSNPPRSREEVQAIQERFGPAFRRLAAQAMDVEERQLDLLPSQGFRKASEEFVRQARAFDPGLSAEDIYQAGRNAWTANGIQWLLGLPVEMTPSILAYSLLYPYTDNYLDDPGIDIPGKQAFNKRFRRRLEGEILAADNSHEQIIFELVAMIESQYPRSRHSDVYESLLAIHHAQEKSLRLLHRSPAPDEVDVLGLSFEKGGTSVLADGCLASPSLGEAQRRYAYGHGIFAQLLDDMEDISQDLQAGRLTVYSQSAGHEDLDALASRTFQFGRTVLMGMDCFEINGSIRDFIQRAADLILIDTVGRMDRYYTSAYLSKIEAHSPFRFLFLKEQRIKFSKRQGSLVRFLETALF
jgi:hypothetical protein